jgi:hypothetical protein
MMSHEAGVPGRAKGEMVMLSLVALAVIVVTLATPVAVLIMWHCIEGRALTVGVALIAASAFIMQAADADAKEFRQPRPDDPERLRMIEECMAMNRKNTYSYSRMVGHMYRACMADHGHHH